MEKLKDNNLIIIGGGCGVAPLKGIIDYVENHRKDYEDVHMFLGYRSPDDIIFKRELETWKKVYNIHVTVDKNAHGQFCYDAKVMMKGVIEILKQKDFHDDQIFISAERLMYCAIGICCHCMIRGKFTCIDGPVFRYDEVKDFKND